MPTENFNSDIIAPETTVPKRLSVKKVSAGNTFSVKTNGEKKAAKKSSRKKSATKKEVLSIATDTGDPSAKSNKKVTKVSKKDSTDAVFVSDRKNNLSAMDIVKKEGDPVATFIKAPLNTVLTFRIKFHTVFGQNLFITGDHEILGDGDINKAVPLKYVNEECWETVVKLEGNKIPDTLITYNYVLRNTDGTLNYDWGKDKSFNPASFNKQEIVLIDSWNFAGYFENAFYTEPFRNVLLKANYTLLKVKLPEMVTHVFRIKAPLLSKGQTIFLSGNANVLNNWNPKNPVLMSRNEKEDFFSAALDLTGVRLPLEYKYGVYDVDNKKIVCYETGKNRSLNEVAEKNKQTIVNDGFAVLPSDTWRGAGMAIPVFALRTESSFGVGEFSDLKLLVDWSEQIGLKLIQLLPVNDTTATHTRTDSYPYAAISAFALHPIYLNLDQVVNAENRGLLEAAEPERKRLNALEAVDYEAVMNYKIQLIQQIYSLQKDSVFHTEEYREFFSQNKHWLEPYAVFCYLRDEYGTPDFNQWPAYQKYHPEDVAVLIAENSPVFDVIAIHYFIQYHLHLQLKEATAYAHDHGIIVKGDIAIGVYRFGADTWQQPELYRMDMQAGAPPDDFAVKGQNWSFPTYNWQRMKEDGFAWWKQRFEQMGYYFDAFRIDHILGFFRIWSIPMHAVEGILGYFVPAIPVHINEFASRGIGFNYNRYVKPFINEDVLWDVFSYDAAYVKKTFLLSGGHGNYSLKPEFDSQRKVEHYFSAMPKDDFTKKIQQGLFDLISNVILLEVEGSNGQQFHFRFAMGYTSSFKKLDETVRYKLDELYINYFFRRQDDFWMKEALQKLPALKRVTNMLICGEDLGLVPGCVPELMRQLGLLSLEIQRMPKDSQKEFFNPADAPYLSVVTPSTHDMSTIRGWWEEDRERIQKFYNGQLGHWGTAPQFCEPWINKEIVLQHLHSPAMWSIFQLQDLLGINGKIRRVFPNDERINIPADSNHYWRYRMHISLENLLQQEAFDAELKEMIQTSGR